MKVYVVIKTLNNGEYCNDTSVVAITMFKDKSTEIMEEEFKKESERFDSYDDVIRENDYRYISLDDDYAEIKIEEHAVQ